MEENWIEWNGESPAVPSGVTVKVDVRYRNGTVVQNCDAWQYRWSHLGNDFDIVAYRKIVKPKAESKEVVPPSTNPKAGIGASKLPLHLISPLAAAYMAVGLSNGAGKYGIANYKGTDVQMSIYMSAILRHLFSIMEGEEHDPVDGTPHFGAIMANCAIILDARAAGTLIDDRPIAGGYLKELDNLTEIYRNLQELHKDKKPFHYTLNNMEGACAS